MTNQNDPDGLRLPIKLDSTSNGEYEPIPLSQINLQANQLAHERVSENARRINLKRREFLVSACGAASTLLAINAANTVAGNTGGFFQVAEAAALDQEIAAANLRGNEFIFDIQGHFVDPNGRWIKEAPDRGEIFKGFPKAGCSFADLPDQNSHLRCLGADEFVKDVFLDSDTDLMVLSFVPSHRDAEPLTIEEASATREIVAKLEGSQRLMIHGRVNPNQEGDLEGMDELAESWDISAWKTYTQWGPTGDGFFLYEEPGIQLIEKAIKLGIKNICIHKGLPFGRRSYEHSLCDDIGIVAKHYPDVNFLVYHSGLVPGQKEGAYNPDRNEGIDSLVKTMIENDVPANSNVYAELGSTWRLLMQDLDSAAHTLGKLFKYVGKDNVVWGTDSIWYGSPQDQIQAFRTFQISELLREQYDYPEMTPELRAKVFGLNAIRPYKISIEEVRQHVTTDHVTSMRDEYNEQPNPSFLTHGPKTRREFLNLMRLSQNSPA